MYRLGARLRLNLLRYVVAFLAVLVVYEVVVEQDVLSPVLSRSQWVAASDGCWDDTALDSTRVVRWNFENVTEMIKKGDTHLQTSLRATPDVISAHTLPPDLGLTFETLLRSSEWQQDQNSQERAEDAVVIFHNAVPIDDSGFVFDGKRVYYPGGCENPTTDEAFAAVRPVIAPHPCSMKRVVKPTVIIAERWGGAVFHNLLMDIPRLLYVWTLLKSREIEYIVTHVNSRTKQYFELLGIEADRIMRFDDMGKRLIQGQVIFDKLYVPPGIKCSEGTKLHPILHKLLLEAIERDAAKFDLRKHEDTFNVVYIRREKSKPRSCTNADQIEETLNMVITSFNNEARPKKRVVIRVFSPTETFEHMLQLFYSADIILAPHGAGLSNMIFSRNPSELVILEQHPTNYPNDVFPSISATLNIRKHIFYDAGDDNHDTGFLCDEDAWKKQLEASLKEMHELGT